jgi:hypothetical protein
MTRVAKTEFVVGIVVLLRKSVEERRSHEDRRVVLNSFVGRLLHTAEVFAM